MKRVLKQFLRGKSRKLKLSSLPAAQYEALDALKCCIWYNRYGGYCLPESSLHRTAARRVLNAEVYEPDTIAYIREHRGDGDIVHAGTYFGDFLPGIAGGHAQGALVWAFEPNPENHRCAQVTCLINDLANVRLHNAGLGEAEAVLRMRTRDEQGRGLGGKSHLINEEAFDPQRDEEVRITSIDATVPPDRNVAIVQLDVEDHEKAALTGALQTIERCRPIIILEVRRGSTLLESEWFADTVLSLGYRRDGELHGNVVFRVG